MRTQKQIESSKEVFHTQEWRCCTLLLHWFLHRRHVGMSIPSTVVMGVSYFGLSVLTEKENAFSSACPRQVQAYQTLHPPSCSEISSSPSASDKMFSDQPGGVLMHAGECVLLFPTVQMPSISSQSKQLTHQSLIHFSSYVFIYFFTQHLHCAFKRENCTDENLT